MSSAHRPFAELVEIMARLRAPGGCPWDREQTRATLRPFLLEETYEVLDALDSGDVGALKEELGDLLLQVVFHAQLATEQEEFTIDDVARSINSKLIRRHPHVFGDAVADTPEVVLQNWEQIKAGERRKKSGDGSPFQGVPKTLPALLQAVRLQETAARVGFDWPSDEGVLEKLYEEIGELREARAELDQAHMEEEFGDMLFLLANLARHWHIDPENALRDTCRKFIDRWTLMQQFADEAGRSLEGMTLEAMDGLWDRAKALLRRERSKD
jgi:tetrapyrrole methylase family protein / MazG family protein